MKKEIFQKLNALPFFTLEGIRGQLKKDPLPFIKYNIKIGKFIKLKRGMYTTEDFVKKIKYQGKFEDYLEFLATNLLVPSYLSLEYILSKYALLTEAPFSLSLITLKTPRIIKNSLGSFSYFNIKKELFCGFRLEKRGNFELRYATKSKALFDFLYLKKRTLRIVNKEVIEELRLNLNELKREGWKEFEGYLNLAKSKKMEEIFKFLKE